MSDFKNQSPWGTPPGGGNGDGFRRGPTPPNIDEIVKNILAKINALNPSPGAWFEYNGNRFKIWKANIKNNQGSPGEVLDKKLVIGCGEKSIQVTEIQKEGKKVLSLDEFLSGNKISIGEKIL